MWLVTWRTSKLPLLSKVAVWQSQVFPKLLFFLPEKLSPSGRNGCCIYYYHTLSCFRTDSQSQLVMGCFCHHGLIKMLFWKTFFGKNSDFTATQHHILCQLPRFILLSSLISSSSIITTAESADTLLVYFHICAYEFSKWSCIRNILLVNTMILLTACLRFCERSDEAHIPFEWAQEHCRSNSRIGNQVHFPHTVVQG